MNTTGENEQLKVESFDAAELERLQLHVDNIIHIRVNLLLVAESLFLAAFAAIWNSGGFLLQLIISVLGVLMTLIIMQTTSTLRIRSVKLADWRKEKSPVYKAYLESLPRPPKQTKRLTTLLPLIFLSGWILILIIVVVRQFFPYLPSGFLT